MSRIEWIDFTKGIGIITVILGHTIGYNSDLCRFICIFHMPLFFVTTGFLLNLDKWGGVECYNAFSMKLVKRLLVPYYLAEFLCYPFYVAKEEYFGHLLSIIHYSSPAEAFLGIFTGKPVYIPLGPLWFLPCLLLTEIIFMKLYNRLNKTSPEIFVLAVVLAAYVGFSLSHFRYLPLGFNVALVSQIFLLMGILIRRHNFIERIDLKVCVVLVLIILFVFKFNFRVEMSAASFGKPIYFYAGGLAGTLLVMKISSMIKVGKIFSLISDCGRQSLIILALHTIVIELLFNVLVRNNLATLAEIYTEPLLIFCSITSGVLIPLGIAKKFGHFPVLKYF